MSANRFPLRSVSLELLSFSFISVDSALVIHVHWFFGDAGVFSEKHEWEREARISAPHGDARIRRFAGSVDGVDTIVSRSSFGQADAVLALASLVSAELDASKESVSCIRSADIDVSRDAGIAAPAVETVESTRVDLVLAVLLAVAVVVGLGVARSHVLVLVFVLLVAVLVVLVRAVLTVPVRTVVLVHAEDSPEQHATEKLHPSTLKKR